MKYAVQIGILFIGVGVGYVIGVQSSEPVVDESEPETTLITETVTDTIIQTEIKEVPVENTDNDSILDSSDSLLFENDSLLLMVDSDSIPEDLSIRTEKMTAKKWLNVHVLAEYEDKDSLLKEALGINETMPSKILVEFWESPLNFSGYKLSKSKLILYGMPSGLDYKLYRNRDKYFLSAQTFYYSLRETEEFLPYLEVSKQVVFND